MLTCENDGRRAGREPVAYRSGRRSRLASAALPVSRRRSPLPSAWCWPKPSLTVARCRGLDVPRKCTSEPTTGVHPFLPSHGNWLENPVDGTVTYNKPSGGAVVRTSRLSLFQAVTLAEVGLSASQARIARFDIGFINGDCLSERLPRRTVRAEVTEH